MDDLKNIFLNVVASFVYAVIVWWWRNQKRTQSRERPPTQPQPAIPKSVASDYDWRTANRQKLQTAILDFLFYFTTFAALYYSIGMPPLLKAAFFTKQAVFISDARVIGSYLPQIQIGKESVQASLLLAAAILYVPLLYVAELVSRFVRFALNPLYQLTNRQITAAQMLSFMVLCVPVAATSVWLFYNKTLQQSFATVLGFLSLFAVFALAQGRR